MPAGGGGLGGGGGAPIPVPTPQNGAGAVADGEIRFDTPFSKSSCTDVTIVLYADDKTKTSYIDKKLAGEIKTNDWKCLIYRETKEPVAVAGAQDEDSKTCDDEEAGEEEVCLEYDSVFKEYDDDLKKEFKLQVGDFLVVDIYMNEYGRTRAIGSVSAIANKVGEEAEKREEKQGELMAKAEEALEKDDRKAAVREYEKIAKAGHRGPAWESAWESYETLMNEGLGELEAAVEDGDPAKVQQVGSTYGVAFAEVVKKQVAALRAKGGAKAAKSDAK